MLIKTALYPPLLISRRLGQNTLIETARRPPIIFVIRLTCWPRCRRLIRR
jgi:hypothetical protein